MSIETIIALAVTCVALASVGSFFLRRHQKKVQMEKDRRERERQERQARKFRDRGENIGGRIYNALRRAAESHPGYAEQVCFANVMRISDNAGFYSIIVKLQEPGVYLHLQATFQIDVPLIEGSRGDQIYVLEGNYGSENYSPMTEEALTTLLPRLEQKTRTWPHK